MIILLIQTVAYDEVGRVITSNAIVHQTDPRTATVMQRNAAELDRTRFPRVDVTIMELADTNR